MGSVAASNAFTASASCEVAGLASLLDAMESGDVEDDAVYLAMTAAFEVDSDTFLRPL